MSFRCCTYGVCNARYVIVWIVWHKAPIGKAATRAVQQAYVYIRTYK